MKRITCLFRTSFLFILMIVHFTPIIAQKNSKTDVLIIGTVHRGNPNITKDTLLYVLTTYKPELILWEMDDHHFKPMPGLSLINRLKFVNVSMENLAIQKFYRKHKSVPILGIDGIISKRRAFIRKFHKTNMQFFNALFEVKMTRDDSLQYTSYRILKNEYIGKCVTTTLESINRDSFYRKYAVIDSMNYQLIKLANNYLVDKKIITNFKELNDFGYQRNNYMAQEIKETMKKHRNKRIIVIVGNAHKYFLVNHLKKEEELDIQWNSISNF